MISALRAAFARVGFSAAGVAPLLGPPDARLSAVEQEALWAHRAGGSAPLAVLARFFLLQRAVSPGLLRRALGGDGLAAATALGWVLPAGRPGVQLSLHADLLIASDPPTERPGRSFVQAPTTATLLLERLLIPGPAARTLDVGTGTGYLALRLGGAMVGSDVSARALRFARLNAALNDRPVTFVRADGLAVSGRFERVVGNLPFVLSPERRFTFRDGSPDLLARAIRGLRARLAPGGVAQYLAQWPLGPRHDEEATFARLAVAAGCDALVLRLESDPADVHAVRWSAGPGLPPDARRVAAWCAHHRAAGVARICTGLITLRRHRGRRHVLAIEDGDFALTGAEVGARLDQATGPPPGSPTSSRTAPRRG
jgi:SAM-dependent methyltransferase